MVSKRIIADGGAGKTPKNKKGDNPVQGCHLDSNTGVKLLHFVGASAAASLAAGCCCAFCIAVNLSCISKDFFVNSSFRFGSRFMSSLYTSFSQNHALA